jgi:hypothetical protein
MVIWLQLHSEILPCSSFLAYPFSIQLVFYTPKEHLNQLNQVFLIQSQTKSPRRNIMSKQENISKCDVQIPQPESDSVRVTQKTKPAPLLEDIKFLCHRTINGSEPNQVEWLSDLQSQIDGEDILELRKQEAKALIDILYFINQASREIVSKGFYRNSGS